MAKRARRRGRHRRQGPAPRTVWLVLGGFAGLVLLVWIAARAGLFEPAPPPPPPRHRLTMAEARAANAAIPFLRDRLARAASFHFQGSTAGKEQAVQCLATAALYEAGDDAQEQKAVIQVVLNRVQNPHFPKTVCGVVYQGASLPTGCQFSFTCDGSELRRPEHQGWVPARAAARRALDGYVFRPVGTATHYHADWMVPYWIGSLDKIAQVRRHIFYQPHHTHAAP